MMFRDQVGILAGWFKGWNECEQTVALLSLLKRVTRTQARFLQLCLEHSLADCNDIHLLESEANSAGESAPHLRPRPGTDLEVREGKRENQRASLRSSLYWLPFLDFVLFFFSVSSNVVTKNVLNPECMVRA